MKTTMTALTRGELAAIDLRPSYDAEATRIDRAWRYLTANGLTREDVMTMTVDQMLDLVQAHTGRRITYQKIHHVERAVGLLGSHSYLTADEYREAVR